MDTGIILTKRPLSALSKDALFYLHGMPYQVGLNSKTDRKWLVYEVDAIGDSALLDRNTIVENACGGPITFDHDPAIWYINEHGQPHRLDGPACTYADGSTLFCINGVEYNEFEYWLEIANIENAKS